VRWVADRRSRGRVNGVLGVLLIALVAATVFLLARGPQDSPGTRRARAMSATYEAVTAAARREAEAFLTVDYRDMAPTVHRVLAGATGQLRREYQRAAGELEAAARRSRAVSTGSVRVVGIGALGAGSAEVYVAADGRVSNTSTGRHAEPRAYRLRLTMTREHGRWLTSDLEFVP
jgi:Mce-associated membrane protein